MMSTIPLHPEFGALLNTHQQVAEFSDDQAEQLRFIVERFGVVVIRDQLLSDAELGELAAKMGTIWSPTSVKSSYGSPTNSPTFRLTNMDEAGQILPADAKSIALNVANELWHTDATYTWPGATISLLYSVIVPPTGGDTEFCDTRTAYQRLTNDEKEQVARLTARHSLLHSRSQTGFNDWTDEQRIAFPEIARPLARFHEPTGRMALCLASHISGIEGWDDDRARKLIDDLTARAVEPQNVYRHEWREGDLLFWDNRCTMHRARPYDISRYPRDLRSTRLVDETELA